MFKTLRNAFKVKDIRNKILYTLAVLVIVRLGSLLPAPAISSDVTKQFFDLDALDFFNSLTGGSFTQMSIFALSITPYISSSIIIQLLTIAIPKLEEMQKEGEDGRKRINDITRYLSVGLSVVEALAFAIGFGSSGYLEGGFNFTNVVLIVVAFTAGATLLMWLGERITQKGVGNGISIILLFNIVSRMPNDISALYNKFVNGKQVLNAAFAAIVIIAVMLVTVVLVIVLQDAERHIPVQYAKKVQGRKMVGGQTSHIPLKVNTAGVIPVIFANSLMTFPIVISSFFGVVANNMKKQGGFIPGIRPGKPTTDYLTKVLNNIIFIGAIGLTIVSVIPIFFSGAFGADVSFGGTSLIIIVGVIIETIKQIESMLLVRHYKGFLND